MANPHRIRIAGSLALALLLLAGCGTPTRAQTNGRRHHHAQATGTSSPPLSAQGGSTSGTAGSTSQGSTGSGAGGATGGSTSGSTAGSGSTQGSPALTYTLAPPSQTPSGAIAQVAVENLPAGWTLEALQVWSSAGEMASETPGQAMTSTFSASHGGFSMGSDGEVISYFFPDPPVKWAGTQVHFTFVYKTASGATQEVSSATFAFPKE